MRQILMRFGMMALLGFLLSAADSSHVAKLKSNVRQAADSIYTPNSCTMKNVAFQDGEEITYKVYYNWNFVWMSAGEVSFRVREEGNQYHLSVHGSTYPSYNWFYKVEDRYDTYIDKQTLLPNVSIRNIQEGKYTLYDKITFDKHRNLARSLRGRSKDKAEVKEYPIENCMHDILSIIYYARNIDFDRLSTGTAIPVKIFMDEEVWPLRVLYKGKDEKKRVRGQGRFKTIQFSPEVVSGLYFKDGTEMNVWVTDDKNRIPLLIESPISVGSIKAVLKDYKNLRHPFEAEN